MNLNNKILFVVMFLCGSLYPLEGSDNIRAELMLRRAGNIKKLCTGLSDKGCSKKDVNQFGLTMVLQELFALDQIPRTRDTECLLSQAELELLSLVILRFDLNELDRESELYEHLSGRVKRG